jgi:hypothetical protein
MIADVVNGEEKSIPNIKRLSYKLLLQGELMMYRWQPD